MINNYLTFFVALLSVVAVTSNVIAVKVIDFRIFDTQVILPGSAFSYVFTFFLSTLIAELYGKKEALSAVKISLFCQLISSLLIVITQWFPCSDQAMQQSYDAILGSNFAIFVANLVAVAISQLTNISLFCKFKERSALSHLPKSLNSIWAFLSIVVSQAIDTLVFYSIAFGIGYKYFWTSKGQHDLAVMMLYQYTIKVALSLVSTPAFYLVSKFKNVQKQDTSY